MTDWLQKITSGHAPNATPAVGDGTTPNTPGIKQTLRIDHADHATETLQYAVSRKLEIVGCQVLKEGTDSGGTVQLKDNGVVAISDAIAAAVDKASTREATLDVAHRILNAGDLLNVVFTRGTGSSKSVVLVDVLSHS